MAITVDYGSMSAALDLANRAGKGQRYASQNARDLQFLGIVDQMQRTADAAKAEEMQNALAWGARQQSANQFQQTTQLSNRDQAMQEAEFRQKMQEHDQQQQALTRIGNGQANDADYLRFGKTPPRGDNNATSGAGTSQWQTEQYQVRRELDQMQAQLSAAHRDLRDHTAGATDLPDKTRPQAKDGHATEYDMAATRVAELNKRIKELTERSTQLSPVQSAPAPAAAAPALPAGAGPAMPPPGAQGVATPPPFPGQAPQAPTMPPEMRTRLATEAAQSLGLSPTQVGSLPPPPSSLCAQVRQQVDAAISDPIARRREFYRRIIAQGKNPLLNPVAG